MFHLLDFNRNAYHGALFKETFDGMLTLEDMTARSPFIGHTPIAVRGMLLLKNLRLLGSRHLSREDLEGYACYLEAVETTVKDIEELLESMMRFSTEPPLPLRLERINDELVISEH